MRSSVVRSLAAILLVVRTVSAQQAPARISDAEFWRVFSTLSEDGGAFPSENFVSNETDFQQVIPELTARFRPGGVYLGVGPEQNFTYIANVRPSMAIIVDIRRQNAMLHLMYKALFEMSATRSEFITRLFARRILGIPDTLASAESLFTRSIRAPLDDSTYRSTADSIIARLTKGHGFALSTEDVETIRRVFQVFRDGGPAVNYSWRSVGRQTAGSLAYVSFAALQSSVPFQGKNMAFLGSEELYRRVRRMELDNLIIPVVGDFGGPKAVRAVGEFLKGRGETVGAYYLSNVEQYLWSPGDAALRFYANVATLPTDSTSMFIRSLGRNGNTSPTMIVSSGAMISFRLPILDVRGSPVGGDVTPPPVPQLPAPELILHGFSPGILTSGLASIRETMRGIDDGSLTTYGAVLRLTRTEWK